MPELKNPRWEKFCQALVLLGNQAEAYRRAGYRKERTPHDIAVGASRLMTFDGIKQRISQLRAKALLCHDLNREELARFYSSVIVTPVGQVDANHPLAQSVEITDKGIKIRLPDKNAAAAGLSRLHGWDAAERVDLTLTNPLTDYLRALRSADAKVIEDKPLT